MRILVVVVNYRTPELTQDCLASLDQHVRHHEGLRVALVDNASGDNSVEFLRNAIDQNGWNDWVDLMPLDHNGGFAYGNNAAIEQAIESNDPPDFVWLLNPDTVVREGALDHLVAYLADHSDVGLVGSRLEDPDGTPQRSAFRFPGFASEIDASLRFGPISRLLKRYIVAPEVSDEPCLTGWVAGASMLVRREVFADAGVLDEKYFMYFEEVDFCLKAARSGWKCGYEPASRVVHLVGQASGVTNVTSKPKRRPTYWFESRRRYFVENHGVLYAMAVDAAWACGYSLWCIRSKLQGKTHSDPPKFLTDFLRNSVLVRGLS